MPISSITIEEFVNIKDVKLCKERFGSQTTSFNIEVAIARATRSKGKLNKKEKQEAVEEHFKKTMNRKE